MTGCPHNISYHNKNEAVFNILYGGLWHGGVGELWRSHMSDIIFKNLYISQESGNDFITDRIDSLIPLSKRKERKGPQASFQPG